MTMRLLAAVLCAWFAGALQAAETYYVDLSKVANTSLEDHGKGGWSGEGPNDMFIYPPIPSGEVTRNGYHFKLIDPARNDDKAVVMLRGVKMPDKPESVAAQVPEVKGRFIYFLQNSVHAVANMPHGYQVATYTIKYADGSEAQIPVRDGKEIRPWWTGQWYDNSGAASWPIFMGQNAIGRKWNQWVGVWAMQWENPSPQKPIVSITFKSTGHTVPVIFAVTITDADYVKSPHAKDDYKRPAGAPAGYFDQKLAAQQKQLYALMRSQKMVRGMRSVSLIRPDLLAVTLDAAVGGGAGLQEAKAAALQKPSMFSIRSAGDAKYQSGKAPLKVSRESFEYWNGDVGHFEQNVFYWHTYYLHLPTPMQPGQTYTVHVDGLEQDLTTQLDLRYAPEQTITPVIKVNQVAYSPLAHERFAYLGWWAGDGGAVDFADMKHFQVIDEQTNQPAIEGSVTLRKAEDSLSGENVYQMDLSALKTGRYHILVMNLGRSDSFNVGGDGVHALYYDTLRAFFHQRCGQELAPPYTTFTKPACHTEVYESGYLVGSDTYTPRPGEAIRQFRGGYHDAADFDVFTYHLRSTAQMLGAYEYAPKVFKDGDLNIPESGNGIPDVLDEADWALFSYRDTQHEDGGVPLGRGNDQDAIRDWARSHHGQRPTFGLFPPEPSSSTEYAAVAAQFARLIRPYDAAKAERYVASARRALAWAEAQPDSGPPEKGGKLFVAWAAAELYSTTGDEAYNDTFKRLYRDGLMKGIHWKLYPTAPICLWPYTVCARAGVDKKIQAELRANQIRSADSIVKETQKPAYRVGRGPAADGNGWGNLNGGGRYADPCLRAYMLTHEQKYLDAACLNADFQLGANPLSKTFITGEGARPPLHPEISAFLYTGPNKTGQTVKGITIYGLTSNQPPWYPVIPSWRRWRDLGNGGAEISSEFTITETVGASAMLYSLLYALQQQ
jgi:hypothetical protein